MSRARYRLPSFALVTVAAVLALAPSAQGDSSFTAKATTWPQAASQLGTAGSLWEPTSTLGLRRSGAIEVVADNLAFDRGVVTDGDTFAGARYRKGARSFTISEKWATTGWAAEPAFTTSMAKVRVVRIPLSGPDTPTWVRATVYANCFPQPTNADPTPVPAGFRCQDSDILRTGGVVVMTARPASTMTEPGRTSIVIQSTGLSYEQLMIITSSLTQVPGTIDDGAGSAQMRAMCNQMVTGRMTAAQASAFAEASGYSARVGTIDGVPLAVTADFNPARFTLSTVSGVVTACTYG